MAKGNKRAFVFALVITLLVMLGSNFVAVSAVLNHALFPPATPLYVDLPSATGFERTTPDIVSAYLNKHLFVSNYKAHVLVKVTAENSRPGDDFTFHFSVRDEGINPLSNDKYLYIVVFDSEDKLFALYPEESFIPMSGGSLPEDSKWPQPRPLGNAAPIDFGPVFNGSISGHEIWYRFTIPDDSTSIGDWRIFVLIFGNNYLDRWGKPLCQPAQIYGSSGNYACPDDYRNAVASTSIKVEVGPEQQPQMQSFSEFIPISIQTIVAFVASYVGYLSEARRIETVLRATATKMRQHWLFVVTIALLVCAFLARIF